MSLKRRFPWDNGITHRREVPEWLKHTDNSLTQIDQGELDQIYKKVKVEQTMEDNALNNASNQIELAVRLKDYVMCPPGDLQALEPLCDQDTTAFLTKTLFTPMGLKILKTLNNRILPRFIFFTTNPELAWDTLPGAQEEVNQNLWPFLQNPFFAYTKLFNESSDGSMKFKQILFRKEDEMREDGLLEREDEGFGPGAPNENENPEFNGLGQEEGGYQDGDDDGNYETDDVGNIRDISIRDAIRDVGM